MSCTDSLKDELSRSPRFLHESAALALARLSVNDREESRSDVTFSDPFHSKRPQVCRPPLTQQPFLTFVF